MRMAFLGQGYWNRPHLWHLPSNPPGGDWSCTWWCTALPWHPRGLPTLCHGQWFIEAPGSRVAHWAAAKPGARALRDGMGRWENRQEKRWASGCCFASVLGGLLYFRDTSQADFHGGHQLPFSSCSAWCLGLAPHIYLVMLPHAPATLEPMPCGGGTCGDTTQRAAVNARRHPKGVHIHTTEQEQNSLRAEFARLGTLVQSKLLSPMLNSSISLAVSAKGSPSSCTKSGITLYIILHAQVCASDGAVRSLYFSSRWLQP